VTKWFETYRGVVNDWECSNGREITFLVQSGVHLDMDARRSTAIPDELGASVQQLLNRDS
jgi:hypothetical protein